MNESELNSLREKAWSGQLTTEEMVAFQATLNSRHDRQHVDDEEFVIAGLVLSLPNVPVPSNFTHRVLASVEHEVGGEGKRERWRLFEVLGRWPKWVAYAPMTLALVVLAAYGYASHLRKEAAQGVAAVSNMASAGLLAIAVTGEVPTGKEVLSKSLVPPVEILQDFEAIRRLSHLPDLSDAQLMAYLQD